MTRLIAVLVMVCGLAVACASLKPAAVAVVVTATDELANAQDAEIALFNSKVVPSLTAAAHVAIQQNFIKAADALTDAAVELKKYQKGTIPAAVLQSDVVQKAITVLKGLKTIIEATAGPKSSEISGALDSALGKLKAGQV